MRKGTSALGLFLLLMLSTRSFCDQPSEIDRLIQRLGDRQFKEREAAGERLEKIGEPALEALREAAAASKDPEIRRRALQLLRLCSNLRQVEGTYYLGRSGMRACLHIDSDGRYWLDWSGCPPYDEKCQGTVRMVQGWLTLTPVKRQIPESLRKTPTRFLPVTWGRRTYLLSDDEIPEFCNSVNLKSEPRSRPDGEFYLRAGDWNEPVENAPTFPPEWAAYLLTKPVTAELIEMVDARTGKLNVGEQAGIRPGMILEAGKGKRFPYMVRVVAVEKGTCLVRELNALIVTDLKKGDVVGSQKATEPQEPRHHQRFDG